MAPPGGPPHNSLPINATTIEAHAITSAARTGGGENQPTNERRDECRICGL